MAKKVIIIGAGPGGLGCAMLLSRAGLDVTVLERGSRIGGRTSSLQANGFTFDRGPTFFLYPEMLGELFALCGRNLAQELDLIRIEPHYRLIFEDDLELTITADTDRLKQELARINPGDAQSLDRFMLDNRKKLRAFKPVLQSAFTGAGDVLKLPLAKLLPLMRPWNSVDEDLKRFFRDPRTRLCFSFQSKYLGMSPFSCPSIFTILSFLEYEYGVFHPQGGCCAVSQAMARTAREQGCSINTTEPVEQILFKGRRATGVRTHRGEYACDGLVINADFAYAMTRLVPNELRTKWTDEALSRKKYSCSTFMMYLGISGACEDLPHHSIFLARDYRKNLAEIEDHHLLSENPSLYVHNPCRIDPALAPQGMSALYVLAPVTHQHDNVDWAREKKRFRDIIIKQLAKIGLADIESRIRFEEICTPADWEGELNIYRGATFSLAHSLSQLLHRRPHNRFEDLEAVYLAGGGTHPGSGLPAIFQSARITSELLVQDLGLKIDWHNHQSPARAG